MASGEQEMKYVLFEAMAIFSVSLLLTRVLRGVLTGQGILDVPNGRSSHSRPVPRGGGLSIVVTFLLTLMLLAHYGLVASNIAQALLGGGTLLALVGLVDDRFSLPANVRLVFHFAASGWAVWCLQGTGWLGSALALVGLVWMINLYNFMDGIDGLAGSEAICVCVLGGLLVAGQGNFSLAQVALLLACACAGFLVWNWPPATIFLGDVGSGFLGFALGVLAIASSKQQPAMMWSWLILLGVFVVDATLTLLVRAMGGQCWYEAHRSHAYQHASQLWGSHVRVTVGVSMINVVWLFPMAWLATKLPMIAPALTVVAMAPLIWITFHFHAGQKAAIRECVGD